MHKKSPLDRLHSPGGLGPIVDNVCRAYSIGRPANFSIIETGYEDCNVIIETQEDKFVAKIFSKGREKEDIARYTKVMEKVVEAGIHHPRLMKTGSGNIVFTHNQAHGIALVLMKFIEGKNFMELGRAPNAEERKLIIEQAVQINSIDHHPPYVVDSWAIPNITMMFENVKKFIQPDDLKMVAQVIARYSKIPVKTLPHCFVHGDMTTANVMRGADGKIYILDFSVANWYPRIQEISIIVTNLLYDTENTTTLQKQIDLVSNEYSRFIPLTEEERTYLYPYSCAGIAMEFLGAHQEKYLHGNDTEETNVRMSMGRNGLKKEFAANGQHQ